MLAPPGHTGSLTNRVRPWRRLSANDTAPAASRRAPQAAAWPLVLAGALALRLRDQA
jgi:hypothetical protein